MQVFGQLTQLVECHFDVVEVRSSSLLLPTKNEKNKHFIGACFFVFIYSPLKGRIAITLARLIAVASSLWCLLHVPVWRLGKILPFSVT